LSVILQVLMVFPPYRDFHCRKGPSPIVYPERASLHSSLGTFLEGPIPFASPGNETWFLLTDGRTLLSMGLPFPSLWALLPIFLFYPGPPTFAFSLDETPVCYYFTPF